MIPRASKGQCSEVLREACSKFLLVHQANIVGRDTEHTDADMVENQSMQSWVRMRKAIKIDIWSV